MNEKNYVLGIDQSTEGSKALLFDEAGAPCGRSDLPHAQLISPEGYISHNMEEVYRNTVQAVRNLLAETGVKPSQVTAIGISNQRETTVAWDRLTGRPVCPAIVWQCARAESVCANFSEEDRTYISDTTGIPLSPYFSAAKMRWILENIPKARKLAGEGRLCMGTVDAFLLFTMTQGREFRTDYSNASRTQLFNIHSLSWDERLCKMFGIPAECLPDVCFSDSVFGETTLEGTFPQPVRICAMLGDSHAALFGHGCHNKGQVKATYGTGSSIMINAGEMPPESAKGLVASLAWGFQGKVHYVLEGNLNYTGAVITWLKDDLGLISSAKETEALAFSANPNDTSYLVPAFSGLGAPYWKPECRAAICGMSRTTGRAEIVRAALDATAYQITDILKSMEADCGTPIQRLCVDGGPTSNRYLMQMQSDIARVSVAVPHMEELSAMGSAYMAGITDGIYQDTEKLFQRMDYTAYAPMMSDKERGFRYNGWKKAVNAVICQ
ncbi:MAG: glycerol kinase GlpK [Lachnospiraceae bacterium]|nr:glycerol kinase GlpK [Lachnospiraceae bacterium]